ncbi:uncharacterized protein LOC109806521 [Cajanus cajan]|uniref:Uncharacterized protein n=1 Tax=Cajanus cajan TaxID=3821 RepID=A0A151SW64_CAJCA|nr:uncharacterized protein LOC109806521 [Cajanus cajan]KYP59039.1 hypothetical protein KK1_014465 [Cajanus cajan]
MEVQSPSVKRHYDITMSRRTRKQFPLQGNDHKPISAMDHDAKTKDATVEKTAQTIAEVKGGGESDHKSLKQLIIGDDDQEAKKGGNSDERSKGSRNSLGEHFSEDHLQLVRMQQKENLQGLKFKKLVRRYAKVLGHLMKAKRDPHLGDSAKKPVFKLSA